MIYFYSWIWWNINWFIFLFAHLFAAIFIIIFLYCFVVTNTLMDYLMSRFFFISFVNKRNFVCKYFMYTNFLKYVFFTQSKMYFRIQWNVLLKYWSYMMRTLIVFKWEYSILRFYAYFVFSWRFVVSFDL